MSQSKWSMCEKTNINKNICQHCQGVQEERERILDLLRVDLEAAMLVLTEGDFADGVRVALERSIQRIDER